MSVLASRSIASRVPVGRIVFAWTIVAAVLVPTRGFAQQTCSNVCMQLGWWSADSLCSSRSVADSTLVNWSSLQRTSSHATLDVKTGTIALESSVSSALPGVSGAISTTNSLSWTDEFHVVGLPPGPPIAFQARLNVTGLGVDVKSGASVRVGNTEIGLRDEASNSASETFAGESVTKTIVLTITASPGQPFFLSVFAHGVARGNFYVASTKAEGVLVFGDLPAGAKVASCGGYLNDAPVPVRRSTWGALKLRYR
jgi:hypothetical protein